MMEGGNKPGGPPGEEELSRTDVRAQREAKKAAKAARKNKNLTNAAGGGDGGGTQLGGGGSTVSPTPGPAALSIGTTATEKEVSQEADGCEMSRSEQVKKTQKPEMSKLKEAIKAKGEEEGGGVSKGSEQRLKEQKRNLLATSVPPAVSDPEKPKPSEAPEKPPVVGKLAEYQPTIHSLFRAKLTTAGDSVKDAKLLSMHPLFYSLGVKLKAGVIRGTNERCSRLLQTIKDFVESYETPSGSTLKHGLSADLKVNLDNLRLKCPLSIGMNNALDFVNNYLYELPGGGDNSKDIEHKRDVMEMIDTYIEEKITKAVEAIVMYGLEKIKSGDVILIYSITEALLHLLLKAAEEERTFELIIIQTPDNRLDIPILLEKLSQSIKKQSVKVSSVNFSNVIYRMRHCSKVIIGGHGLFTTGGVMAESGSGELALLAATYNKPAVFLCETYKFCDRSPLDFFTLDEYVAEQPEIEEGFLEPKIKYDVTPANLVTVVITDIDVLPSTSVPVVLRVQEGRSSSF